MGVAMRVLITGSGGPAGMNALRFIPSHIQAWACDADEKARERMKKTGINAEFYQVPYANHPDFLEKINEIVENHNIDLIIPTVDEELVVLSEKRHMLKADVIVSPHETIKICNDKFMLYQKFKDSPFCPKHMVTDKKEELLRFFRSEKILAKPRISRGSRGVFVFESPEEVPDELVTEKNIFCEYLPGREYTVDVLCDTEGNLTLAIPRQRLKTERGVSIHGRTERNNEILECVEKICNSLKFTGPINIQFKYDNQEKPKLIEINPRLSGGFPITVASGVNPLEILFHMLEGREIERKNLSWSEREFKHERV